MPSVQDNSLTAEFAREEKEKEELTLQKLTLNSKLLKLRLQSKLHLQMCAMLSQNNKYPYFLHK